MDFIVLSSFQIPSLGVEQLCHQLTPAHPGFCNDAQITEGSSSGKKNLWQKNSSHISVARPPQEVSLKY